MCPDRFWHITAQKHHHNKAAGFPLPKEKLSTLNNHRCFHDTLLEISYRNNSKKISEGILKLYGSKKSLSTKIYEYS